MQILKVFGTEFLSFYNSFSEIALNEREYNSNDTKILYLQKYFAEICEGLIFSFVIF